ncbi:MAG: hypothetical protein OXH69_26055 [Acidobacteria bacterium]|nr:hypothetical protein [Acidobacteriota bacterium]
MVSLKRAVAVPAALVVVVALGATGVLLHGHDPDAWDGSHADCDACHFRHPLVIEADRTPATSAPDRVAHVVPSVRSQREPGAVLGIRPTRGPPA